jgi:hypothetical protein
MVQLPVRGSIYIVPPYSLTGDILSFRRCGLQYRYLNGSALPPSRPVQMWFGEFIHLVMEMAIKNYQEGVYGDLPWPEETIDNISDIIIARLATEGKTPRSRRLENAAKARVKVSINNLGPILFPLVSTPEIPLSGTRIMPPTSQHRAEYYEVTGRIDIITNIQMDTFQVGENQIVDLIRDFLPNRESEPFEVIVDYKGMRRPSTDSQDWQLYEWQLQTYAWIRQKQPGSLPVRAGLIIFINELLPSVSDIRKLREEMASNTTDIRPTNATKDLDIALRTTRGEPPFGLSWPFRMQRALRLVSVEGPDQQNALERFDEIVAEIEDAVATEVENGSIRQSWPTNPVRETCVACDFRGTCEASPYRGPAVAPLGRPDEPSYREEDMY